MSEENKKEQFELHTGFCKWCNQEKEIKNWCLPNLEIAKDLCADCFPKVARTTPSYFGLEITLMK